MSVPTELKYTREHEWVRVEGEFAVVGVSSHAQEALGDIVFVELPESGRALEREEPFAVVESVKAVSDVYSPVKGEVSEINAELEESPELVNSDPYGGGWIARIRLDNDEDLSHLMDAEAYEAFLEEE